MEVLIVDGSTQIIQRLEEMITELKFISVVYTTNSYSNATAYFDQYQPPIVLMGVNMPENESLRLLAKISASPGSTSVILLFSNRNEYIDEQCRLLGAQYFLDKYEDFEKIPAIINGIAVETYK